MEEEDGLSGKPIGEDPQTEETGPEENSPKIQKADSQNIRVNPRIIK
jgi:hypothetical protein